MKHVLILGATSDIARALARDFLKRGSRLTLAARRPKDLEADLEDLRLRHGGSAQVAAVAFDALDFDSHPAFYAALEPKPDTVVCVFGLLGEQARAEADFAHALTIIHSNYAGAVSILHLAAADMQARGRGEIVGVGSVAGDRGRQSNYVYGSAKAGFAAFLAGLRNRLAPYGVRVLTVKPGFVATRMTEGLDLPAKLTAEPAEVSADILRALDRGRDVVYTKWFWRYIMLVIVSVPEFIFKRLKL